MIDFQCRQPAAAQAQYSGFSTAGAPWRDIGYHLGIERVGDKYEVLPGRPECERDAHCAAYNNMNASSIRISLHSDPIHPSRKNRQPRVVAAMVNFRQGGTVFFA